MAEAALRRELRRRKITGYTVQSAAMQLAEGSVLNPDSARVLAEAKITVLKSFRPRQLTEKLIRSADVVVCMTQYQQIALRRFPNVTSFPALCGREIPDPYGMGIEAYRKTLALILSCLPRLIEALGLRAQL